MNKPKKKTTAGGANRALRGGSKKKNAPKTNFGKEAPVKKNTRVRAHEQKKPERVEDDRFEFVVVGKNPVLEALRSDLQVEKLLVLRDNADHVLKELKDRAKKKNIVVQSVDKAQLEELADGLPHQGVAAMLAPFPYTDLDEMIKNAERKENPLLVLVDHVTDPHNFGAIIRNANVCDAQGVIFPARRSAGLSPAAVKASSGAAAHTPLAKVTNLAQTIDLLKKRGYWIAAADMDGQPYYKSNFRGKTALLLGAEDGLSPALKKKADFIVSIPVYGEVDSMNVSCASAVILAEAARQRFTDTK